MNKKMVAPIVISALLVIYFVAYAVLLLAIPELHLIVKLMLAIIPLVMAGYALWAAKERIEEIRGGEDDDLSQY